AASLPLPSGAATAAKQDTGNTSLASIDSKTPALGQALAAASVPVVLTAAQISTLTPLSTVAATQSGTWNLNNISGTVSLPTGASTAALQTTGNTSLSSIDTKTPSLGQATMVNSSPVVIASNQSALTVAQSTASSLKAQTFAGTPTAGTVTQAAITVGTTAVRLTVSGSAPSSTRILLAAIPDPSSTATFYIGSSSVTNSGATRGIPLTAAQSFVVNNDAGDYYIVASTASQTVFVME